jgi:pyruvate dehydrogenase E1 component
MEVPTLAEYDEFLGGSKGKEMSTTMGFVRLLDKLCRDKIGKYVVPIVPDESRTFGMEGMFRKSASTRTPASCTSRSIPNS